MATQQPATDSTSLQLSLLTDLLSPANTALPSTTPALITFSLATLQANAIPQLTETIATSPSLWGGRAVYSANGRARELPYERAKDVYLAVLRGFTGRLEEIRKEYGEGWRARRQLSISLEAFWDGLALPVPSASTEDGLSTSPYVRLVMNTGLLAALQDIKSRKDPIYVGGRQLLPRAEDQVLVTWAEVLEELKKAEANEGLIGGWESEWTRSPGSGRLEGAGDPRLVPSFLASEVLPDIPVKKLRALDAEPVLDLLTTAITTLFDDGHLLDHLDDDLVASKSPSRSFDWVKPSPSRDRLTRLAALPLSKSLGRLAQTHGKILESLSTVADLESALDELRKLESIAKRLFRSWSATRWADVTDEGDFTEAEDVWNALKNYLFSVTLIYASLVTLLTDSGTAVPAKHALELGAAGLRTFQHLFFVTTRIGSDSVPTYKKAWWGLIDSVTRCGTAAEVESIARSLEPEGMSELQIKVMPQSQTTHYLDVLEQLVGPLPDSYIDGNVLAYARSYLDAVEHRAPFESAHSVILAVFAKNKMIGPDFAPFYTKLLLRSYPDLMTASQLRLGFTTMTRCVSMSDDALAWWCILQLVDATTAIPIIAPTDPKAPKEKAKPAATTPLSSLANVKPEQREAIQHAASAEDYDPNKEHPTRLDEIGGPTPLETQALQLRRGHLLLVLIDQVTVVNLVLLRSLLDKIWAFLLEEECNASPDAADDEMASQAREALLKVLFGTLGDGLDMTKREEGIRWWLARRWELKGFSKQAHM